MWGGRERESEREGERKTDKGKKGRSISVCGGREGITLEGDGEEICKFPILLPKCRTKIEDKCLF